MSKGDQYLKEAHSLFNQIYEILKEYGDRVLIDRCTCHRPYLRYTESKHGENVRPNQTTSVWEYNDGFGNRPPCVHLDLFRYRPFPWCHVIVPTKLNPVASRRSERSGSRAANTSALLDCERCVGGGCCRVHVALLRHRCVEGLVLQWRWFRSHVGHGRWLRRNGPGCCPDSTPREAAGGRAQAHPGSQEEVRRRPGRPSPVRLRHLRGTAAWAFADFLHCRFWLFSD